MADNRMVCGRCGACAAHPEDRTTDGRCHHCGHDRVVTADELKAAREEAEYRRRRVDALNQHHATEKWE